MDIFRQFDETLEGLKKTLMHWDIFVYSFWPAFYTWQEIQKSKGPDSPIVMISRYSIRTEQERTYAVGKLIEESEMRDKKPNLEQTINLYHLTILFSFIEALADEAQKILISDKNDRKRMSEMKELVPFLETVKALDPKKTAEFKLAKEIRNCFIHRKGKVDKRFLEAFKTQRSIPYNRTEEEPLFFQYDEYEKWHLLILEIAERLEKHLKS